jgi:AcrR family transcriptional regulator
VKGWPRQRRGDADARGAILGAARRAFADRGYDAASLRGIAGAAGVDPALVHHYFGSKQKLFLAAVNAPVDPRDVLVKVVDGDRAEIGQRLVRTFLAVWDGPAGSAGVALLRSAIGTEWAGKLFREFIVTQIVRRLGPALDLDPADARLRISLVASQIAGLAMARYVLRIEPLASASPETIVVAVAPAVQRYLTGDVTSLR